MTIGISRLATLMLAASFTTASCSSNAKPGDKYNTTGRPEETTVTTQAPVTDNTRIQVAILLDTSNSMDGLIEQAKSRLWNIINTLTTLKYNGKTPTLEIALYEYGNDGLSSERNYIRQVTPLTTDLDLISEKLFALRTNGGLEYCGAVIQDAVRQLEWGNNNSDMKLVYIAGNEPFDQGNIHYKEAISSAVAKKIYINTIFCGNRREGVATHWKDGADKGKGKYFNIDSDRKVRFIETPYDARIEDCDRRLNDTYIGYGTMGASKKAAQGRQDENAKSVSKANYTERAVTKSKAAYKNSNWDLVDKVSEEGEVAFETIEKAQLPGEYKDKSKEEVKQIVALKTRERKAIQKEIEVLSKKRQAYIDEQLKNSPDEDDLGNAITSSILEIAKVNGYIQAHN